MLQAAINDKFRKKHDLPVIFGVSYHDKERNAYPKYPGFKGWEKHAKKNQSEEDIKSLYNIKGPQNTFYSYYSGCNGLLGVDFDWEWPYDMACRRFNERMNTRTIKTANGGYRALFFVDEPQDFLKFKTKAPHVEMHGNPGKHHLIVHGKALDDKGNWSEYKVIKDVDISYDPKIFDDLKEFLEDIAERM